MQTRHLFAIALVLLAGCRKAPEISGSAPHSEPSAADVASAAMSPTSSIVEAEPISRSVAHDTMGPKSSVYFVIDGMLGHAAPDVATSTAVETFEKSLAGAPPGAGSLEKAFGAANAELLSRTKAEVNKKGMGVTAAALWLDGDKAHVAHVGDCRVYLFRDGKLTQLTEDHSLLNDYLKTRKLTPEEIADFPMKNVVVRALGMKDAVQVEMATHPVRSKDLWLVATAGLTRRVDAEELSNQLAASKGDARSASAGLRDAADKVTNATTKARPAFAVVAVP